MKKWEFIVYSVIIPAIVSPLVAFAVVCLMNGWIL